MNFHHTLLFLTIFFFGDFASADKDNFHFGESSESKAYGESIPTPEEANAQDSSSNCGGKLRSTQGTISYKNYVPYIPNERCIWFVRAPNATSYNVELESLGASGLVSISTFGLPGLVKQSMPSSAANISFPNANVLVILFSTSSANNTNLIRGFSLRYTSSILDSNQKASATSEDIFVPANIGHIKYPSNGSTYGNFDLSLILVMSPLFGLQDPTGKTELIYIRSGLEGLTCQDKLTIYTFDRTVSSDRWRLLGRMCGGVDSELISSQDIIMIVFESDFSGVSSGFHLYSRYVNNN